jgi:hypothetical protein
LLTLSAVLSPTCHARRTVRSSLSGPDLLLPHRTVFSLTSALAGYVHRCSRTVCMCFSLCHCLTIGPPSMKMLTVFKSLSPDLSHCQTPSLGSLHTVTVCYLYHTVPVPIHPHTPVGHSRGQGSRIHSRVRSHCSLSRRPPSLACD